MFAHINACKESNQRQNYYCKHQGIAYSTFQYWAKKYRKENSKNEVTANGAGFIPVKVREPAPIDKMHLPGQLHFLLPNGVQVMCSETISAEVLKTLLNPSICLR